MKRSILIMCAFLVVFAGVAAAWASCKENSLVADDRHPSASAHKHDHHSHSDRHHSKDGAIHCPPIGDYLATATFTVSPDNRLERLYEIVVREFDRQFVKHGSYPLIHGPPGSAQSRNVPRYLSLSVLRI